jgi:hypothetical protein
MQTKEDFQISTKVYTFSKIENLDFASRIQNQTNDFNLNQ